MFIVKPRTDRIRLVVSYLITITQRDDRVGYSFGIVASRGLAYFGAPGFTSYSVKRFAIHGLSGGAQMLIPDTIFS